MRLLRPLTRLVAASTLLLVALQTRGDRPLERRRLHCPNCGQSWFPSVYLPELPQRCALCGGPLSSDLAEAEEAEMPALWEMRLTAQEHMLLRRGQEVRPAEDLPLEALELLLDGVYRFFGGSETGTLGGRALWAELVLQRALEGFSTYGGPSTTDSGPVRGRDDALERGERIRASLAEAASGREAALAIAGLSDDDLRSALLAAACADVGPAESADRGRWLESMAGFTTWRRPQDLL